MMELHYRLIYPLLSTVILTLCSAAAYSSPSTKVEWSIGQLEVDAPRGMQEIQTVTFSVSEETGPVALEATPSLQGIISFNPKYFESLEPGKAYSTHISAHAPSETGAKVYGGTIHLREGSSTLAKPLNTKVNVTESDEESYISRGTLILSGVSEDTFNSTYSTLTFKLEGVDFSSNAKEIKLYHQGKPVPDSSLNLSSSTITVNPILGSGKNEITIVANDAEGNLVYRDYTLWAGSNTLRGTTGTILGQRVDTAEVTVSLGDDSNVKASGKTVDGQFSFTNLPGRTLILTGDDGNGLSGSAAANGSEGWVFLPLIGFYAPSNISNNDFSLGLSGWSIGDAPVSLQPHSPEVNTAFLSVKSSFQQAESKRAQYAINGRKEAHEIINQELTYSTKAAAITPTNFTPDDMDLVLSTSGEGPQTISRTFNTTPGVRSVLVRYRFITTEVPGGYYGTRYNDYYSINVRSASGGAVSENNSMNGMGLGAFDSSGATDWREKSLSVDPEGETVQVDITVANVFDGWLNSKIVVDFIEERSLAISSVQLNDIDNSQLQFLSASPHNYFNGQTRVHGTITLEGEQDDSLNSVLLEVVQGGTVVATGNLDQGAQGTLLQPFGDDNQISIDSSQLLFNLDPAGINSTVNGTLSLRVKAQTESGDEVTEEAGTVNILRQIEDVLRYGQRDETEGGDDWVIPSVANLIEGYDGLTWGDFSNMNAGRFAPHASHRNGNDGDGWFNGYNARDAATASTIIDHLNEENGDRITFVFVTFVAEEGNAFYDAISDITLNDGRLATDVIRPVRGHSTHYHWRVAE